MNTQLVEATPATRDRFVDFLRAASITVVVLGHWLMAVIEWRDGQASGSNALDTVGGAWATTWLLQVMPIFFFVGGFSNLTAWDSARRRGEGWAEFMRSRLTRLLKPTALFAVAGLATFTLMRTVFGASGDAFEMAATLAAKPLWFLAVYVMAIALAPAMLTLHRRFGARVPLTFAACAVAVDVARIGFDVPVIGFANFAFVWLIPHQLGFFYADGTLQALSRRATAMCAAAALAILTLLTTTGPYAASMVGGSHAVGAKVNNNTPPSIALIALAVWLISATLLLRPRITAWLQKPRVWVLAIGANSMIMTVFLWHLLAMFAVAAIALPAGFPQPEAGTPQWWLLRPVWILAATLALTPLVLVFGRVERNALLARRDTRRAGVAANAVATVATIAGLASLAQWGFGDGFLRPAASTATIIVALRFAR